ncbi:ABC transporter permease subunit [Peptoniphilus asaccharolyticus]|uniref:ABC transporter permease subunit n=1 Tax=Peptoniphilus asaccharolyticus TaxID=1258 RepID=UPI002E123395|nr:ABC transporter permease subunit [Peptoniphilus asaccharolyticus]
MPLALSVIMSGIQLSAVYVIAWTTLASYIGAGGLGDFIFNGLNNYIPPMIIWGTIPVSIMALLADFILGKVERKLSPYKVSGGAK